MILNQKKTNENVENQIAAAMQQLREIYSNKSSDEYKSRGDITKTSSYESIENMLANLSIIRNFPKTDAADLKNLFNVLHRPIFKKMVSEYLTEPTERNTLFAAVYMVGYRTLLGELARIYTSTEADEKGFVYKPDRISRKQNLSTFIRCFNNDLERKLDDYIRNNSLKQEGVIMSTLAKGAAWLVDAIPWMNTITDALNLVFGAAKAVNPISLINKVLSDSYEKKVQRFESACAMYEETKKAYDEYMKIPAAQRKQKVESQYVKNIEKYNIKMKNLQAQIAHYDQRAIVEARENAASIADDVNRAEDAAEENTVPSNSNTDDNDFDF